MKVREQGPSGRGLSRVYQSQESRIAAGHAVGPGHGQWRQSKASCCQSSACCLAWPSQVSTLQIAAARPLTLG